MDFSTTGKVIECKGAVAWAAGEPLKIETVQVAVPKTDEVRVKIAASGFCHTDITYQRGEFGKDIFPCILGHEGAGIVESVGSNVSSVAPGDHVILLYLRQCNRCEYCKNPDTNLCLANAKTQPKGLMADGTTRFTCRGQQIKHIVGCSTFVEYTVTHEFNIVKVNPSAPLDKICLIGCGVATGYGAAINSAKVKPGSTVTVWGLGGVGLAAVMGAKNSGAARIIGIDINPAKAEIAKQFGITDFVNPQDHKEPIEQIIVNMTNGGVDFALECSGVPSCMKSALASCRSGWGVLSLVGVGSIDQEVPYSTFQLLMGRTIKGSLFGGWQGKDDVPKLVEEYLAKKLFLDELISHTLPLESINEIPNLMITESYLRAVIKF